MWQASSLWQSSQVLVRCLKEGKALRAVTPTEHHLVSGNRLAGCAETQLGLWDEGRDTPPPTFWLVFQ